MVAEVAWSIVTFFVIPIIIIDKKSVIEAVIDFNNLIGKIGLMLLNVNLYYQNVF